MSITPEELAAAMNRVADGDAALTPQLAALVLDALKNAPLERIEHEVLLLVASGYTYEEISARLRRSVATIEAHISNVLRRFR